jgi:hypothetical protein
MYQPYPSTGQVAGPLRPAAPGPVRTAVKFMYGGAAVSTAYLIIVVAVVIGDIKAAAHLEWRGHVLTAAQLSHWRPLIIAVVLAGALAGIAVWLWMARATGRGRNWARIVSTVLFGLATVQLASGGWRPVSHAGFGVTALVLADAVLTWLAGAAAVWLLWRLESSAFFRPLGVAGAQPSSSPLSRISLPRGMRPR